ncbi:MAG: MFS transporter, partial [Ilumatobacter sp.]
MSITPEARPLAATDVASTTDRSGAPPSDPRRWAILVVVCVAVFVTTLDGLIVNIALPTLSTELSANTRQLQWIVDAYLLVFTGLLLAAGGLGDRFGRKRTLIIGLTVFGATSAYAGTVGTAG